MSNSYVLLMALLKELLKLGLPLLVSMAAIVGLGVTDTIMAGLASTQDLAALAVGSSLYLIPLMLLIGLLSVVAPRVSWQLGAGRSASLRSDCWQSMWMGLVVGLVTMLLVLAAMRFLPLLKLEAGVETVARHYLSLVVVSLPLLGVSLGLRNTIDGLGYPVMNMWVSIGCLLLNALLDYLFVFGKFGFPKLGAVGCAIATVGVVLLQIVAPALITWCHKEIKRYQLLSAFIAPEFSTLKTLFALGLPAAFAVTLEECFFSSTSLLVAPMGTTPLAAHQIVLSIAMVALIIPIAMGQAAAILIGRSLGTGEPVIAANQSRVFLLVILMMTLFCCVLMLLVRDTLLSLFTDDAAVIVLGSGLLLIVSFQLIVDGIQIGSNIALKGYQDTFIPALLQLFSYWIVGFPLAYAITKTQWFGAPGGVESVWYALFAGLTVASILGAWRLFYISGQFASGNRVLAT
jgi:MATE family multidrug resistance protein